MISARVQGVIAPGYFIYKCIVDTFIGSMRADERRKRKELTIPEDGNCGGFGFTCEIL